MGLTNAWTIATTSLATNAGLTSLVSRNIANAQNATGIVSARIANLVTGTNGAAVIQSVAELTNASLFASMLSSTSANAAAQELSDGVAQLQQSVADATGTTDSTTAAVSPSSLLQSLSAALQTWSSSPGSATAGRAVLSAAQALASGLNAAGAATQSVRETADRDMLASVDKINGLLSQFQQVNIDIVNGTAIGADVTDALDRRATLLQGLSNEIGVTTTLDARNSMSIHTDSGVVLFDGTPRDVSMAATTTATANVTGAAVLVDGVPVTGAHATMPIQSGALYGLSQLRDEVAPQYQSQLDALAGGLVDAFAETSAGGSLPGLFTSSGMASTPGGTLVPGLAGALQVSAAVDPAQGGNVNLLRDGGINGAAFVQNSSGASGYNSLINAEISALSATRAFPSGTGLSTSGSVMGQAAESASWLDARYQSASNQATYQSTLSSQASQALSNATGVNIDAQMSHLLDLENSYQASAKLISTINTMFNALLQAVA
jgi:flagellar hook-associated protein 1 FlgK